MEIKFKIEAVLSAAEACAHTAQMKPSLIKLEIQTILRLTLLEESSMVNLSKLQ